MKHLARLLREPFLFGLNIRYWQPIQTIQGE
jgi:hypothetical protein